MVENLDISRILGIGTIGLGFLLAFLAFRLLNKEQSVAKPRDAMLKAINRFMIFSFSLCIIGLSSEIYRIYASPDNTENGLELQQGVSFPLTPEELEGSRSAAEEFLTRLDKGLYQEAYDSAPTHIKKSLRFDDFKNTALKISDMLGAIKTRKFYLGQKTPGPTPGGLEVLYYVTFISSYDKISNVADSVTLIKDDDAYKVVNYMKY